MLFSCYKNENIRHKVTHLDPPCWKVTLACKQARVSNHRLMWIPPFFELNSNNIHFYNTVTCWLVCFFLQVWWAIYTVKYLCLHYNDCYYCFVVAGYSSPSITFRSKIEHSWVCDPRAWEGSTVFWGKTVVAWCVLEFTDCQPHHEYFFITIINTEAEVMEWERVLSE